MKEKDEMQKMDAESAASEKSAEFFAVPDGETPLPEDPAMIETDDPEAVSDELPFIEDEIVEPPKKSGKKKKSKKKGQRQEEKRQKEKE